MKNLKNLLACFIFCILLSVSAAITIAQSTEDQKTTAAIMAAENFLLLVDTGQYGQSWDEASALFRKQVNKQDWLRQLEGVRGALGALSKREIISAEYVTEVPGAPDGEYVVIRYKSSFDNKQNSVETVTPMLAKDGQWRVSGYYIK